MEARENRLVHVDALRGVAALLVVLHHSPPLPGFLHVFQPVQRLGFTGVGLFLVLSGFSIHYRWAERTSTASFSRRAFWRRRFWRLYPTYVTAAVVGFLLYVLAFGHSALPVPHEWALSDSELPIGILLLGQMVLVLANIVPAPYIGVVWTLALEVQIYAVYSIVVRRIRAFGVLRALGLALAVALAWRVAAELVTASVPASQTPNGGAPALRARFLYSQVPSRCFEWMLGLALAEHYFGRLRRPAIVRPGWIGAAVVAGAGLLFLHPSVRLSLAGNAFRGTDVIIDPLFGIGFALVVLAATERERRRRPDLVVRAFAVIGLFSYSLYLMHLPLLAFGRVALRHLTTAPMPLWVGTWVIVLAGAGLLYVTVERHFIRGRPSTAPLRRMILRAERTAPYEAS